MAHDVRPPFEFDEFRDETYFPSGNVSCRPDGSASYLIDPALNTKAFLDVISAQTGTSLAQAKVTLKDARAPGRIGAPIAENYDAHVEFGRSVTERPAEAGPRLKIGRTAPGLAVLDASACVGILGAMICRTCPKSSAAANSGSSRENGPTTPVWHSVSPIY